MLCVLICWYILGNGMQRWLLIFSKCIRNTKTIEESKPRHFFLWNSNIQLVDSFLDSLLVHVSDDEDDWMVK